MKRKWKRGEKEGEKREKRGRGKKRQVCKKIITET